MTEQKIEKVRKKIRRSTWSRTAVARRVSDLLRYRVEQRYSRVGDAGCGDCMAQLIRVSLGGLCTYIRGVLVCRWGWNR